MQIRRDAILDTIGLQIQRQIAGNVNTNNNVIFDTVVNSFGAIVYNSVTGEITINKTGRYFINWSVATQTSLGASNITFSIQTSQGDDLIGNSPIKTGEVVGFTIIQVDSAPVALRLINETSNTVFYSTLVPIKANLVLGEILRGRKYNRINRSYRRNRINRSNGNYRFNWSHWINRLHRNNRNNRSNRCNWWRFHWSWWNYTIFIRGDFFNDYYCRRIVWSTLFRWIWKLGS